MLFGYSVAIQNLIMFILTFYILLKTFPYRRKNITYKTFNFAVLFTCITQFASTFVRVFKNGILPQNQIIMTVTYFIMFSTIAMPFCFFFQYLIYVYKPQYKAKKWLLVIIFSPLIIFTVLPIISLFNGCVFSVSSDCVYTRGPLFYVQMLGPFIYVVVGLILMFYALFTGRAKKIVRLARNYSLFLVATIAGTVIQVFTNLDGGYSQIGLSLGVALLYVELYVEELKASERVVELAAHAEELKALNDKQESQLKEIQSLNEALKANENDLSNQLSVINCMAKRYFCAYFINLNENKFKEIFTLPYMTKFLGKEGPAKETLKLAAEKLVLPRHKEIVMDLHNVDTWKQKLSQKDMFSVEYEGITSGWSRGTIFALKRDENGILIHALYVLETIHEQKENELRLAKQLADIELLNKKLESSGKIMANAGFGMWEIRLKDGQKPTMEANEKMLELLGIEDELTSEEIYEHWYSRIEELSIPSVEASVREMIKGKFSENTYKWRHPKKGLIYTRCGGTATLLEDGTYQLQGYHGDVTKIVREEKNTKEKLARAREEAENANAAKTAFLFNMSHDIRTPMNAIMGFRTLLELHQDDPVKRADYLKKMEEASNVLLAIINNVLEMARIEKGAMQLEEEVLRPDQFKELTFNVFEQMMEAKGIEFSIEMNNISKFIYCDTLKMKEIFMNLISNAYKYTNPGGKVIITVEELPCFEEGYSTFKTTISDTGIGMSDEFIPHLFDEFAREQNTTESKEQGTGLGMSIVKKLVDLMSGTIDVSSKKGVGTTISVTLNHKIADADSVIQNKEDISYDINLFKGKKILLVEDNDLNAEIAIEILQEAYFEVDRVSNGQECLDKLINSSDGFYSVILMDIQMPVMNGYEATKKIRLLENPNKANIPIVAMTANAFTEDRIAALRSGMNGHLSKPVKISTLLNELNKIIAK